MFILFLRYLSGYVRLRIWGDFPERFLNICAANSISLWNIKRHGRLIYANINIKDYMKIRSLRRKSRVHIKIISKKGLYFLLKPYFKRSGVAIGLIIFVLINVFLSSFIWNVEITGNKSIKSEEIIRMCEEIGIGEGTLATSIDTNKARLDLLMNNKELSWCSFIIEGSHLTVNVSETDKFESEDKAPTNFIASRDGVIKSIIVSSGKAVVKKEQAVTKGQLLATGVLEYKNGVTRFAKCSGEITAEIERVLEIEVPYKRDIVTVESEGEKRKILGFFGNNIILNYFPVNYKYEKNVQISRITKDSSYLPICIYEVEFKKVNTTTVTMDNKEVLEYARQQIKNKEKKEFSNAQILDYSEEISYNKKGIRIKRTYSLIENIAIPEKIKINTVN